MSNILFFIRYNFYVFFRYILNPKKKEYIVFFMGKYPKNIRHGFKAILDPTSLLRYSVSQSTIIVRFTSTKNLNDIQQVFNRVYNGYVDSYFLFHLNKKTHISFLCPTHYNHLYNPEVIQKPIDESLDKIQYYIDVVTKMRHEFMQIFSEAQNIIIDEQKTTNQEEYEEITMNDIDLILDKIKERGIESLTEQEKTILKKFKNK